MACSGCGKKYTPPSMVQTDVKSPSAPIVVPTNLPPLPTTPASTSVVQEVKPRRFYNITPGARGNPGKGPGLAEADAIKKKG